MHTIVRAIEVILAVIFLVIIGFMLIGGSFTDKPEEKPAVTSNEFIDTAEPIVSQTLSTERLTSNTAPSEEFELWTEEEVTVLAKMLWGEARGVPSDTEKAACVWCVLNRVDQGMGTIVEVVTAPYQFVGYQEDHPVDPDLKELCEDVLERWYKEKAEKPMLAVYCHPIIFSSPETGNIIIFVTLIKTAKYGRGIMNPLMKIERRMEMRSLFYILSTMAGLCLVGGIAVLSGGREY